MWLQRERHTSIAVGGVTVQRGIPMSQRPYLQVLGLSACRTFYIAWRAVCAEDVEGGDAVAALKTDSAKIKQVDGAARAAWWQLVCTLLAFVSSTLWFVGLIGIAYNFAYAIRGLIPLQEQAKFIVMWWATIVFDSLCNDLCAYVLAFTVYDGSLSVAQQAVAERSRRGARELKQHDVACRAVQAGPTRPQRAKELAAREAAAREQARGSWNEWLACALDGATLRPRCIWDGLASRDLRSESSEGTSE